MTDTPLLAFGSASLRGPALRDVAASIISTDDLVANARAAAAKLGYRSPAALLSFERLAQIAAARDVSVASVEPRRALASPYDVRDDAGARVADVEDARGRTFSARVTTTRELQPAECAALFASAILSAIADNLMTNSEAEILALEIENGAASPGDALDAMNVPRKELKSRELGSVLARRVSQISGEKWILTEQAAFTGFVRVSDKLAQRVQLRSLGSRQPSWHVRAVATTAAALRAIVHSAGE